MRPVIFSPHSAVPVLHNIRLENIGSTAATAAVTDGAADLISKLEYDSWKTFCLTRCLRAIRLHLPINWEFMLIASPALICL